MINKTVLITGANGQLGSDIAKEFMANGFTVISFTHVLADITNFAKMREIIEIHKPQIVINAAAYHNVDLCEANPEKAMEVNFLAPENLAKICYEKFIQFIHFSTDYVFDGEKNSPYLESDEAKPLNEYGKSKLAGEEAVLEANPNALILRVSALYGKNPCRAKNGLNFVQLMLKKASENADLKVVSDEFVSPTSTESIAKILPHLVEINLNGIVHLTSEGSCSWYEFAKEIFTYSVLNPSLSEAKSTDFPGKTPRPKYSVLENARLKSIDTMQMPDWKTSLHNYLQQLNK
jgi:dTDP-4-dehydrorhamnose reductase